MKIIFDNIVFSRQRAGGISVVWFELLERILRDNKFSPYFVEYGTIENNIFRKRLSIPENKIITKSNFLLNLRRYFNPGVSSRERFIFHSSYYRISNNPKALNITTVHDFTYDLFMHGLGKQLHIIQKYNAIRKSDAIICISENTKRDLLKFVKGVDPGKIFVVYNGVSNEYFPLNPESDLTLPFERRSYLIYIGSRASYKNFNLAVQTVSLTKYNLLVIGGGSLKKSEIRLMDRSLGKERYCHYVGLDNTYLNVLYNFSFALLYPSTYEGFGIPVIEAQSAGCPVISYNCASIREIVGDTMLTFNELNVDAILEKIYLIENEDVRNKEVSMGLVNAKRFSWDKTYRKVADIYELLMKQSNS